jgi:hypothetical protein
MKKTIVAWKRKKNKDKILVQSQGASEFRHHEGVITSNAPIHFHFSSAKCLFATEEKEPASSISKKASAECDLTLMSSTSTYSGNKSGHHSTSNNSSRRSVDAPGLVQSIDLQLHYSGSRCDGYRSGSESSSTKGERRARLLSPSRVLICHAPAPEWPPVESSSVMSRQTQSEKENNAISTPNRHRDLVTSRDSNKKTNTTQLALPKKRHSHLYNDENESIDSNPPPDFHPRKEIVYAIKCHEEMGRALSKLALNKEINDSHLVGGDSFTSAALTGISTFESFSTNSFRESGNVMQNQNTSQVGRHSQCFISQPSGTAFVEHKGDMIFSDNNSGATNTNSSFQAKAIEIAAVDSWSIAGDIEWSSSSCSQRSNITAKSDCTTFSQHVAFLESLEDHMKKFNPEDQKFNTDAGVDERCTFFPSVDDLKSPPSSVSPSSHYQNLYNLHKSVEFPPRYSLEKSQAELQDVHSLSPPCTPASINYAFPSSAEQYRPPIGGEAILQGIAQIKEETTTMIDDMGSKLKSDLKELLEKEVVQMKSIVSEIQPNSAFLASQARFSTARNAMTPQPQRTDPPPLFDRTVLSDVIQKSLRSIESSILDKITLHMDRDALMQREYLEEMIDEKVSRVIAGQNLELQMALGEMKRATSQATIQATMRQDGDRRFNDVNKVVAPPRYLTPIAPIKSEQTTPNSDTEPFPLRELQKEPSIRILEDSFAETMKVIDDFVADCDDLVGDFDKIAFRMEDSFRDNDDD